MQASPRVRRFSLFAAVMCLCLLGILPGCGNSTTSVTGKVTVDDKKIVFGKVNFVDADKKKYTGDIAGDGTYRVLDIPPGQYKVYLESGSFMGMGMGMKGMDTKITPPKAPKGLDKMLDPTGQVEGGKSPAFDMAAAKRVIPMKYKTAHSSGLTCTVKSGEPNTFDIPMRNQ